MFIVPKAYGLNATDIQGMLDRYTKAVEEFPSTVNVPAPLPEHDVVYAILKAGDWQVEDITEPPVPVELTVDERKAQAKFAIDMAAGTARLKYITDIPGQEATYLLKAQQAETFTAQSYKGEVPPMIAAEAASTDQSAQVVVQTILATRDYWVNVLNPQIEGARVGGKSKVDNAKDSDGVDAARDKAIASLAAI